MKRTIVALLVGVALGAASALAVVAGGIEHCEVNPPDPITKINVDGWQLRSITPLANGASIWYVCQPKLARLPFR